MSKKATASEVFDRDGQTVRSRLVDLAALLDRLERAEGFDAADLRYRAILASLGVLADGAGDYATRVHSCFSLPYDAKWRTEFGL
jgi:hypothetical protein